MMTKQNDTAALTDEQLDGVAGGLTDPIWMGPEGLRSSGPTPHPSPVVTRRQLDRPGRAGLDYPASLPRSRARGRATKQSVAVVNPDSM